MGILVTGFLVVGDAVRKAMGAADGEAVGASDGLDVGAAVACAAIQVAGTELVPVP